MKQNNVQIIFSERAYAAIITESEEFPEIETGGVLLGYYNDFTYYVIESIDPGYDSEHLPHTFEYNQAYVNRLSSKISRLYEKRLDVLGIWHKHPGGFDSFSATDDETNSKFLRINPFKPISCLVNIDPNFRITPYYVQSYRTYEKVSYKVQNLFKQKDLLAFRSKYEKGNEFGYQSKDRSVEKAKIDNMAEKISNVLIDDIEPALSNQNIDLKYKINREGDEANIVIYSEEIQEELKLRFTNRDGFKIAVNSSKFKSYEKNLVEKAMRKYSRQKGVLGKLFEGGNS